MIAESLPVVFDKKHALARMGGLEDVLSDVMALMATETRSVYAGIADAYQRRDAVSLKRSAHTLKGSVSLMGAGDLVKRLKRVEDFAEAGQLELAAAEFGEIDRQFAELQRQIALELPA